MEEGGKIRAFVAIKPPVGWNEPLRLIQQVLREELRHDAIRWVKPEQIHITLRFLGNISPDETKRVVAILSQISATHRSFKLQSDGLGCFPNSRRPRVIWAGLSGDIKPLQALQSAVTEATRDIGDPPEVREFKPHLTLARVQQIGRPVLERLEKAMARGLGIAVFWPVTELLLMRSHLSPAGASYETVTRCELV